MDLFAFVAHISWWLLVLTMIIRPLNDLINDGMTNLIMKYRGYLGVTAGVAAIVHLGLFLYSQNSPVEYLLTGAWDFNNVCAWGMIALILLVPIMILSCGRCKDWFKKHIKIVQGVVYTIFVFTAIHIALIEDQRWFGLVPFFVWVFLWLWVRVKKDEEEHLEDFIIG